MIFKLKNESRARTIESYQMHLMVVLMVVMVMVVVVVVMVITRLAASTKSSSRITILELVILIYRLIHYAILPDVLLTNHTT